MKLVHWLLMGELLGIHLVQRGVGLCKSCFLLLEYSIEYRIEYSMDTGSSY